MNILHTIGSLDPRSGGTTTAVVGMAEAQARAGLSVTVLAIFRPGFDGSAATKLRQAGVEVVLVGPVRSAWGGLGEHKARISCLIRDADVVHLHGLWEPILRVSIRCAQAAGKPIVITTHGMLDRDILRTQLLAKRIKKQIYLRLFLRNTLMSQTVHFTSQGESDSCSIRIPDKDRVVVPLVVKPEEFRPFDNTLAPEGWPDNLTKPIVLFYGRIHPIKGIDLLAKAFARLQQDDATLVLAGPVDSFYQQQIRSLFAGLGIANRVIWTGMLQGTQRAWVLRRADVMVLPSFHENFGNTIFEGLLCGVPVVISRGVKLHAWITSNRFGVTAERNPEAIAAAVQEVLGDLQMKQRIEEEAEKKIMSDFGIDTVGRMWKEIYSQRVGVQSKDQAAQA